MPFSSKFPMHITNALMPFLPKDVKERYSEYRVSMAEDARQNLEGEMGESQLYLRLATLGKKPHWHRDFLEIGRERMSTLFRPE
ncbi:hypothetical protein NEUTE1DRAFT_144167 [Neurospora tetrasperma FGSC 2508]|uniref:Uncharacterized protein n=1 Tax=Neurospora tetrasperma (strain FGSC 2508 / ATCC MYA-4615 / P0657) TaxID=510951 RepID=F8MEJ1_NEUT8|nr:uncharacterized protein NEUTE1DRAFT_144167 [Neurospora tetrasperma FGSC 2508]EGO60822.1 hypothetical protein NEUTE1DRAFT_144167 [Neurospora tetrasperma FGSC 2508]EGZ75188.1 hypothetical protein NEUTE2DRAFT_164094 [Neurospora tetrasperma FGSC 2509]